MREITGAELSHVRRFEEVLGRIDEQDRDASPACLTVYDETARISAVAAEQRREFGRSLGPLDGMIVSIKDLFDQAGEVTRAGSPALAKRSSPATQDAVVVQRIRSGGAAIIAKTNMSEFAFSGVGLNPHFGTPANPYDNNRVPGGSSSGAAVSVAAGFCDVAIGTDTGGSVRIPAALCGLVGFKPTQSHVPLDGTHPLSFSLDSIGPIARSVDMCARAYAVLSDKVYSSSRFPSLCGLRFGAVLGLPLEGLDLQVGKAYENVLNRLSASEAIVVDQVIPELHTMIELNRLGGLVPAEAFYIHHALMEDGAGEIDPNIRARLELGQAISAANYLQMIRGRCDAMESMRKRVLHLDALIMPTVPIVAPTFEEVSTPDGFSAQNPLLLRNTSIANYFGLTSISLPVPGSQLPVGLMLTASAGEDERLLAMARAVEAMFAVETSLPG